MLIFGNEWKQICMMKTVKCLFFFSVTMLMTTNSALAKIKAEKKRSNLNYSTTKTKKVLLDRLEASVNNQPIFQSDLHYWRQYRLNVFIVF